MAEASSEALAAQYRAALDFVQGSHGPRVRHCQFMKLWLIRELPLLVVPQLDAATSMRLYALYKQSSFGPCSDVTPTKPLRLSKRGSETVTHPLTRAEWQLF